MEECVRYTVTFSGHKFIVQNAYHSSMARFYTAPYYLSGLQWHEYKVSFLNYWFILTSFLAKKWLENVFFDCIVFHFFMYY